MKIQKKNIDEFDQKSKEEIIANKIISESQNCNGEDQEEKSEQENNIKEVVAVINSGTQMAKGYSDTNSQRLEQNFKTEESIH